MQDSQRMKRQDCDYKMRMGLPGLKNTGLERSSARIGKEEKNRKIRDGEREYLAVGGAVGLHGPAGLVAERFEDLVVVAVLGELILAAIARRRRSLRRLFSLSLHVGILVPDVIPSQEPPASTSIDLPPTDKEGSVARSRRSQARRDRSREDGEEGMRMGKGESGGISISICWGKRARGRVEN
ncbi:hypothetical protein C4D60_Mb10t03630 [Musa balbisiana]|uniref:Uncharacterized protein n=1 Tax=Musa balbisiana TaxID=52838 RepID=A0A4S8IUG6_MUSBA|nr:hypothetical protein C4D60_Mb10t03630 [Musa balbisiana]